MLPFTTVYLSIQDPTKSTAGQDLLSVTHEAAKKKRPIRVAVISQPSDLEKLAGRGVTAVRAVAPANGYFLAAPKSGSGTPAWLIILGALGGAAVIAGVIFFALRRWLLAP